MNSSSQSWHSVANVAEVPSPALLLYHERIEENIRLMLKIAGGPGRLRPHIKTHKLPELIRLQMAQGITKFKCATIAEAEMAASCGKVDLLLAYQPVGPNVDRLIRLIKTFPAAKFSAIADDAEAIRALSNAAQRAGVRVEVLLDIDCGMHRSGILPGKEALALYRLIASSPGLAPGGLHAYDGHINDTDPTVRFEAYQKAFVSVHELCEEITHARLPLPAVVAGGTPTFPFHARDARVECSPGTCVFWDFGYGSRLRDMAFLPAALLLTRVVSKPWGNRLCLDLGHKAVASENPHPRVHLLELPDAKFVSHSEEHLVVETDRAGEFPVGACLFGIPWHVCPTVALHSQAVVIRSGRAEERWRILARDRQLTI